MKILTKDKLLDKRKTLVEQINDTKKKRNALTSKLSRLKSQLKTLDEQCINQIEMEL